MQREEYYGSFGPFFGGVAPSFLAANGIVILDYTFYAFSLIRCGRYDGIANPLHV